MSIMRFLKNFDLFVNEGAVAAEPAPAKPAPAKPTRPAKPTKPERPTKPEKPSEPNPDKIDRPSVDPAPKAEVDEDDVVKRFFKEIKAKGQSVDDYLKGPKKNKKK